jgi:hypothetical protein
MIFTYITYGIVALLAILILVLFYGVFFADRPKVDKNAANAKAAEPQGFFASQTTDRNIVVDRAPLSSERVSASFLDDNFPTSNNSLPKRIIPDNSDKNDDFKL